MRRSRLLFLGLTAVLTPSLVQLHAQTSTHKSRQAAPSAKPEMLASVDPALFKGLQYRLVGPSRGGRVTTVTGVPSQPHTFYMGAARSTRNWPPCKAA